MRVVFNTSQQPTRHLPMFLKSCGKSRHEYAWIYWDIGMPCDLMTCSCLTGMFLQTSPHISFHVFWFCVHAYMHGAAGRPLIVPPTLANKTSSWTPFTEVWARISNHIRGMWDVITNSWPNFNVWFLTRAWMSDYITLFYEKVITCWYPYTHASDHLEWSGPRKEEKQWWCIQCNAVLNRNSALIVILLW